MRIDTETATYEERIDVKEFETKTGNQLIALPGGKEPPDTTGNWLLDLPVGTVFTVEDKQQPRAWTLGLMRLINKTNKMIELQIAGHPRSEYANPYRFVNQFNLYENLGLLELAGENLPQEETKEPVASE